MRSPCCGSGKAATTRAGSPWTWAVMLADGGEAIADLLTARAVRQVGFDRAAFDRLGL